MCENGVNIDQMRLMIDQVSSALALSQQSLGQIHHLAGHAEMTETGAAVEKASALLSDAIAELETAKERMEADSVADVTVERV